MNLVAKITALTLVITGIAGTAIVGAKNARDEARSADAVARGRYVVRITGCNDCHTPGYAMAGGAMDEKLWLTGDSLGWQGAWGTTYPANLRLFINSLTEAQWVEIAHTLQTRPPMPWFNLHAMSDEDLKAVYWFVRTLGPAGEPAPAYLPPGVEARTPVVKLP